MEENYTQNWVNRLREGRGLEEPDDRRKRLNIAIAIIATDGCENIYISAVSHKIQKAARMIMRSADQQGKEPLECLISVCDGYEGLDVCTESFLLATKYV